MNISNVDKNLKDYVDKNVLSQYDDNIGGHGIDHVKSVITRSFEIINEFNLKVNPNIVYVVAAFHDVGYKEDADNHEKVSARKFLEDNKIKNYFANDEISVIAEAIVDHRASLEYEARSVYGRIVSSADRETSVNNMLTRSVLFYKDKHAKENPNVSQIIEYSYEKLFRKFGNDGYAKMYYKDKKYDDFLTEIRKLLNDKDTFIEAETRIYEALRKQGLL